MTEFAKAPVSEVLRVNAFVTLFQDRLSDTRESSGGEAHDFWEFLYLESGSLSVLVDGELYALSPGELILYPPHSFHSVAASSNTMISVVSFSTDSPALFDLSGEVLQLSGAAKEVLGQIMSLGKKLLIFPEASKIRGMVLRDNVTPADTQRLSNLLELFLLDLFKTETRSNNKNFQDDQFAAFTDYLKTNLNRALSLEEISEGCAIGAANLQKLCRKQCGCGPVTYFISLKIGAAKRMMQETSLNFTQIAEQLGFSSVHYFSKLFKAKTGMSPSAYARTVSKTR